MILTTTRSTFELSLGSMFISRPSFELHFQARSERPLMAFDKRREGADLELWGFGLYMVISRKV